MIKWETVNKDIDGIYLDTNKEVIPRHNYLTGSRNYALAILEQLIGFLSRKKIDDNMIIFLIKSLIELAEHEESYYFKKLKEIIETRGAYEEKVDDIIGQVQAKYSNNNLSSSEKIVLSEISSMNLNEYILKSDYEKCDYGAMKTLSTIAYQFIVQGLQKCIDSIEIFVGTNGEIVSWEYSYCDEQPKNIWIEWTSLDKVDHYYSIYSVRCSGLREESMLDLASADAVEKEFTTGEKRVLSYNMLVKQYCGVIEQEINEIIQLTNLIDKPTKHLMWNDMKKYVKQLILN